MTSSTLASSWRPALLLLAAIGCGPRLPSASATLGAIELTGGFAYEPILAASGAAYVQIANRGTSEDTLLAVTSPAAAGAMFHGGSMSHLMTIAIPAGGRVLLEPGGTHIMFSDFTALPTAGDSLTVTLVFARAGSVTLELPVRRYGDE